MRLPKPMAALVSVVAASGCASRYEVKTPPPGGFDAGIVLGCPNERDGRLSRCQVSRAAWAAELYRRGALRHLITSGGAVHSRYVEAESLAAALQALGVPPDRIYLDPDALHTDENVYNGMRIARALGFHSLAVVSNGGHAGWACRMMVDFGQPCGAFPVDVAWLEAHGDEILRKLDGLRCARVGDGDWLELDERERRRAAEWGRRPRPPSFLLYPYIALSRALGQTWVPIAPPEPTLVTWAERQAEIARTASRR